MAQGFEREMALTLAELLTGNQVESKIVMEALKLLCDGVGFDCGMIYESDASNCFQLKEKYATTAVSVPNSFPAQKYTPEEREYMANQAVYCIEVDEDNSDLSKQLLEQYSASALLIAPVVDENLRTHGIAVLLRTQCAAFTAEEKQYVPHLLSMLVRYVGVRMYQNKITQAMKTLGSILDNTGIDIYVNDFYSHEILYVNKSMAAPYGGPEQFMDRKCWQVLFPGQKGPCEFCPQEKLLDENGEPSRVYSWDYQRTFDGSWFRVFSAAFRWTDGRLAHVVSSADITDNKMKEATIEYLANYDQLTKLPNRRMLIEECERRINNAAVNEQGYLLFFDIDGFKSINDTLGHDEGDEFLMQLGEFFTSIPMLDKYIYRNGGDEFVSIIGGEGVTKAHIQSLAAFIHTRFQKPWKLKSGTVTCGVSIGVACYPEDGVTVEPLLQVADRAMYLAKKRGGGQVCFGYELQESSHKG